MSDEKPYPHIGIAPYGGSLRSISLAISNGGEMMMHQHLTPDECVHLARRLLEAAEVAERDEITPPPMSMSPQEVATLTKNGERIAA